MRYYNHKLREELIISYQRWHNLCETIPLEQDHDVKERRLYECAFLERHVALTSQYWQNNSLSRDTFK